MSNLHRRPALIVEQRPLLHSAWNRKSISMILDQHATTTTCTGVVEDDGPAATSDGDDETGATAATATISGSISAQAQQQPHYSLLDLISMGVGGTVGSGIFVLTGYISHHYAGPATFVSFLLSGSAALCSGLSYAEWSWRVPVEGSTYIYAYVALGEYAAVLAGACLTLEYGVSGAAVARSWGDKVLEWMRVELGWSDLAAKLGAVAGDDNEREGFFKPLAGIISLLAVTVLAWGVQVSKRVTNFFTVTKVILVLFMIVGGLWLFDGTNMTPLIPPELGASGVLRGATSSFFGYLGFDEVCCLASEAKNPADMPKAVLWTLAIVTVIYVLASIALCGMQSYENISDTSGFPAAFADRGVEWAAQLTAAGEVFTLPVVVLISLLAQPRLFAAMAKDGLLPAIFARQTADGNFFWGVVLSGIPMTLLATFVPFSWMDDAISVGILFAFNMTNTALILMKCRKTGVVGSAMDDPDGCNEEGDGIVGPSHPGHIFYERQHRGLSLPHHLLCYHMTALVAGLLSLLDTTHGQGSIRLSVQLVALLLVLFHAVCLQRIFPSTGKFGDSPIFDRHDRNLSWTEENEDGGVSRSNLNDCDHRRHHEASVTGFEVPLVPFLPLLGILLNWYLIAQLDWTGMLLLLTFLAIISGFYVWCVHGRQRHPSSQDYSHHQAHLYNPVRGHGAVERPVLVEMSVPPSKTKGGSQQKHNIRYDPVV